MKSPVADASALAAAEFERDRLFKLSLDLLCFAGFDGYLKQINPSWTRILGWSQEELLSRPVIEFIHPEDRARALQARAQLEGGLPSIRLENRYRCKDGSYRWFAWQSVVETDAHTVFGVARDVTEQRQANELKLMTDKLESTAVLAGGLAHDFNNLLTGLMLNLEMLENTGTLSADQRELLQHAFESAQAAKSLTWKLLRLNQGDTVGRETEPLHLVLEEAVEAALRDTQVQAQVVLEPALWPVRIDRDRIRDVLRSLLTNAREAQPHGGTVRVLGENITLTPQNLLKLPAGAYARLRLIDEGVGISEENLPKVFDPYFSTKSRGAEKGMGLGLSLCHATIRRHGGTITVNSRRGHGTSVAVYLPAAFPAPAAG